MITNRSKQFFFSNRLFQIYSSSIRLCSNKDVGWSFGEKKQYPSLWHRDTDNWFTSKLSKKGRPSKYAKPADYINVKHKKYNFPYVREDGGIQYFNFVYYPKYILMISDLNLNLICLLFQVSRRRKR